MEASETAAAAEGFHSMALMSTMPGLPLYERHGFVVTERVDIVMPDGTAIAGAAMEKAIPLDVPSTLPPRRLGRP